MSGRTCDEFAVDENGLTSDGYHRIVAASLKSMYIGRAICLIIVAASCLAVFFYAHIFEGYENLVSMGALVASVAIAAYLLASPIVFYKRYRYRIDEDRLEIRRGIMTIRHILVPVERIHQVEVVRGPINRMFGLSDVMVTTAGGTVRIQFLEDAIAETIADSLNESVIKLLKSRDP